MSLGPADGDLAPDKAGLTSLREEQRSSRGLEELGLLRGPRFHRGEVGRTEGINLPMMLLSFQAALLGVTESC